IEAGVIMDDHVHLLVGFTFGVPAATVIHSWKSITAHDLCGQARTSPLWQAEYYQRWLASPRLIDICASYIRANPRRKWQGVEGYRWLL
ncbi:MAG TPA: transposase, partial [Gemmatimonadales bacterium]|nr:transposase [Gemmatimonadales bacterium]